VTLLDPTGKLQAGVLCPAQQWGDLLALRLTKPLPGSDSVQWAEGLRNAVMSRIGEDIPPIISGHGAYRHVAWTAIPDVGHRHGNGNILALGCWLPSSVTSAERQLLQQQFSRITQLKGLAVSFEQDPKKPLTQQTWSGPAQMWGTVTPIALDRWPKKNYPASQVICDSLVRLGLPKPELIECRQESAFKGAIDANHYKTRNRNRQLTHAVIHWDQPIEGPLLIGAERFFGGGLCRPFNVPIEQN
jgi:CRISPR-associated protein Csb2